MTAININTDALVVLTNKLEKMRRSDLPIAVMNTLNSAAFDVKMNTMIKATDKEFIKRRPSFWKAKSKVFKASGWDIEAMQSMVGFVGSEQAVEDLEQQQEGGEIDGRSFIPTKQARVSKNERKMVRANARLAAIKKIVDPRDVDGASDAQKFRKSAIHAGVGGHVRGTGKWDDLIWRVNAMPEQGETMKLTALYTYESGRAVRITATDFMGKAADMTAKKIPDIYAKEAQRRFEKAMK